MVNDWWILRLLHHGHPRVIERWKIYIFLLNIGNASIDQISIGLLNHLGLQQLIDSQGVSFSGEDPDELIRVSFHFHLLFFEIHNDLELDLIIAFFLLLDEIPLLNFGCAFRWKIFLYFYYIFLLLRSPSFLLMAQEFSQFPGLSIVPFQFLF